MKYLEYSAGTPDRRLNRLLWLCGPTQYMADTLNKALKAWHLHLHNAATSLFCKQKRTMRRKTLSTFYFLKENILKFEILLSAGYDKPEGLLSSPWTGKFHIRYSDMDIATQKWSRIQKSQAYLSIYNKGSHQCVYMYLCVHAYASVGACIYTYICIFLTLLASFLWLWMLLFLHVTLQDYCTVFV